MKLGDYMALLNMFVSIIVGAWLVFGYLHGQKELIDAIHENTLRNTITNEALGVGERLNACDTYLDSGYNSTTKIKCERLYESAK